MGVELAPNLDIAVLGGYATSRSSRAVPLGDVLVERFRLLYNWGLAALTFGILTRRLILCIWEFWAWLLHLLRRIVWSVGKANLEL